MSSAEPFEHEPLADRTEQTRVYGGFDEILRPSSPWIIGGFGLPDGSFWQFQEPNATVVVQNGRLRVTAMPLTRSHDRVQFLDNAKHMYFSRERIDIPEDGAIAFELGLAARTFRTRPGDLYDGFVSFNLLDFSTGFAFDFFVSSDRLATVYARLPFPGVPLPESGTVRYFCMFNELALPTVAGEQHVYRIQYDRVANRVEWSVDGGVVNVEADVPGKLDGFTLAMGLMTEKEIGICGSASLHGQGIQGEWSATTITRFRGRSARPPAPEGGGSIQTRAPAG